MIWKMTDLELSNEIAEYVTHDGAEEQQDGNHHEGDQYQDQRELNQTLALLSRHEQHGKSPPFHIRIAWNMAGLKMAPAPIGIAYSYF